MLERGTIVSGYRVDGVLGVGGMGVVYEATQLSLERTVALKLISSELGNDAGFRERFRREGMIQAAINHPHIVPVHEAGESEQGLFIAMSLIPGRNLKDLIVGDDLTPRRTVHLLTQVAGALDAAHEAALIHRDIKPYNILVDDRRDHAYLADFGVTKARSRPNLTKTGQMVGTLDYMAPEQIRGLSATEQTDIYALGCVLYECFTGTVPFYRETDAAVLYAHLSEPLPSVREHRGDLPPELDVVLLKAMAKLPEERYVSATELLSDIAIAVGDSPRVAAPAVPTPARETAAPVAPETVLRPDADVTETALAGSSAGTAAPVKPSQPETEVPTVDEPVPGPYTPPPPTVLPPADETTLSPSGPPTETGAPAVDETVLSPPSPAPETPAPPPAEETVLAGASGAAVPAAGTVLSADEATTEARAVGVGTTAASTTAVEEPAVPGRHGLVYAIVGIAAALALVGGFFAGRATTGGSSSTPQSKSGTASEGRLAFSYPATWRRLTDPPKIPGLNLAQALALAPDTTRKRGLLAGSVPSAWPSFVPPSFRKQVPARVLQDRQIVRLGGLDAFQYSPQGYAGTVALFLIPQEGKPTTAIACYATNAENSTDAKDCPSIANRVRVEGATSYTLSLPAGYAATFNSTMRALQRSQATGVRKLGNASTGKVQAGVARSVSTAYGRAVRRLRRVGTTPYIRPANQDVVAALASGRGAYARLAAGASAGNETTYDAARRAVQQAGRKLNRAISDLRSLGFQVAG